MVSLSAAGAFGVQTARAEEEDTSSDSSADASDSSTAEMDEREQERQACYAIDAETNSLENWPEGPSVYADSAIVMDIGSGAILYGKQIDKQQYPASITKILTAMIALQNADMETEVTFSDDAIAVLGDGASSIGMTAGEVITMEDALYATLLASANECAYAVGETVGTLLGGDYDTFIEEMNRVSTELGCTGSNWVNTNGLHDDDHYTTAHDMALIGAAAYQTDGFIDICQTMSYTIAETNLMDETRTFQQKHKMLISGTAYYYENATAGKTGYTTLARNTLVTMADDGNLELVAVVLYDFGSDSYTDTADILDYVFDNFSKVLLSEQELPDGVEYYEDETAYVVLPEGVAFSDLDVEITQAEGSLSAGTAAFTYQGQPVGTADVHLSSSYAKTVSASSGTTDSSDGEDAEGSGEDTGEGTETDAQSAGLLSHKKILAAAGAVLLIVLIVVIVLIIRSRGKGKTARRRRQKARIKKEQAAAEKARQKEEQQAKEDQAKEEQAVGAEAQAAEEANLAETAAAGAAAPDEAGLKPAARADKKPKKGNKTGSRPAGKKTVQAKAGVDEDIILGEGAFSDEEE